MACSRVLILEDDRDIRASLRCGMEIDGYEVMAVGNGLEGIRVLENGFQAELIILDLMMPVVSGPEFLEYRAKRPSILCIPVIVISATKDMDQLIGDHRVEGRLTKPFALSELCQLAQLLGKAA